MYIVVYIVVRLRIVHPPSFHSIDTRVSNGYDAQLLTGAFPCCAHPFLLESEEFLLLRSARVILAKCERYDRNLSPKICTFTFSVKFSEAQLSIINLIIKVKIICEGFVTFVNLEFEYEGKDLENAFCISVY